MGLVSVLPFLLFYSAKTGFAQNMKGPMFVGVFFVFVDAFNILAHVDVGLYP